MLILKKGKSLDLLRLVWLRTNLRDILIFVGESSSMMFTAKIKNKYILTLPAITHVDYSSRLQTVSEDSNLDYYNLIMEFVKITGIEMILNTSFNLNGMFIVETPEDAIECFVNSDLDYLALENFLISRM